MAKQSQIAPAHLDGIERHNQFNIMQIYSSTIGSFLLNTSGTCWRESGENSQNIWMILEGFIAEASISLVSIYVLCDDLVVVASVVYDGHFYMAMLQRECIFVQ